MTWRVRGHRAFGELARAAPRRAGALSLRYRAGPDDREPPRIAFAIARNVGSAPVRNRLRRRLRSAMRSLELRPGSSYLVGAGIGAVSSTYDELVTRLGDLVAAAHGDAR